MTVKYVTANGTATAPTDYTAKTLTMLTFAPGVISKPVTVAVKGDTAHELNEYFFVNLSAAVNATIADAQAKCAILNGTDLVALSDGLSNEQFIDAVAHQTDTKLSAEQSQALVVDLDSRLQSREQASATLATLASTSGAAVLKAIPICLICSEVNLLQQVRA